MEKPTVIKSIEKILGVVLQTAPERPNDRWGGLMAYKEKCPKYVLEGDQLVGLNIANTGLNDEKWQKIAGLEDCRMEGLRALNLSDNLLTIFAPTQPMRALERLNLGENRLTRFEWTSGFNTLTDIRLDNNPLENVPPETLKQGRQAVLRYFRELQREENVLLLEAKLLIIGAGGVGKTSLLTKLQNPDADLPKPGDTTVGISITIEPLKYAIENKIYTLNAWDFGGQDIYHPTHQLFLTKRSVYVLMQDGREKKTDFDYWLQAQELLAGDSPLLLVQNTKDNSRCDIPFSELRARYPNVQKYFELDLKEVSTGHKEFERVVEQLKSELKGLPHVGDKWPLTRVRIREALQEEAKICDWIELDEYRAICGRLAYPETTAQDELLEQLHYLGVVLHFDGDVMLDDLVIIHPQWATDAIYAILDHTKRHHEKRGHFNWEDLKMVWKDKKYKGKYNELLRLMQRFELIYELPEVKDTYIAPMLLPEDKPAFDWDETTSLQMRYEYDFLPKGILSRLIVRLHEDIENQTRLWKRGVVLGYKNTRAQVIEEYNGRRILLSAKGPEAGTLMEMICKELDSINATFQFSERLRAIKKVPCNCELCISATEPYFFDHATLESWKQNDTSDTIQCQKSGKHVQIGGLLSRIIAQKHRGGPLQVFISYSKHDIAAKETLLKHLTGLRGQVLTWDDSHIRPGEEWDKSIKTALQEAHVVLYLVTHNSMATSYIQKTELPFAETRHQRGECLLVPIIADFCSWEDLDFAKYNALPAKGIPVTDTNKWVNQNQAWMEVVKGIRLLLEDFTTDKMRNI